MIVAMVAAMLGVPVAALCTPTPVTLRDDVKIRLSVELATLLNSEASTRVQLRRLSDETFPQQFANDPNFAILEREYPGITGEAIAAMMPVLTKATMDELPVLQRELATVYAKHLTAAELREVLQFYRGPTGSKVIDSVSAGVDFSQLVGSAMRSQGEAAVTEQDLSAGVNAGVATMIRALSDTEAAEIVRFGTAPAGRKLAAMSADAQRLAVAIANRPRPEMEKQVEAAVTGVIERRIAQGDGK